MLTVGEIRWIVHPSAGARVARLRRVFGDTYTAQRNTLRTTLCDYFNRTPGCLERSGAMIYPIGGAPANAKALKVRWGVPGRGRSGGLRFLFAAYCDERRVVLCGVWNRSEDPSNDELMSALGELT